MTMFPLLEAMLRSTPSTLTRLDATPTMDVYRRGSDIIAHIDLPGVSLDDITVDVADGWITVSAQRAYAPEPTDTVVIAERPFGTMVRKLRVPGRVSPENVSASLVAGVLTITASLTDEPRATRVHVSHGDAGEADESASAIEDTAAS